MYTTKPQRRSKSVVGGGLYKKEMVNDIGLGGAKGDALLMKELRSGGDSIDQEYGGMHKDAGLAIAAAKTIASIALLFIPVVGWVAAAVMQIPVVGDNIMKIGLKYDPFLKATTKFIGKMMQKATHMGDCMKWWQNESNIRGMIAGITAYPIDAIDPAIVMSRFVDATKEYRLQHATEVMDNIAVKNTLMGARGIIGSLLSRDVRQNKMASLYVSEVRKNPELMQVQCAVHAKSKGESIDVSYTAGQVGGFFEQLKEQARQQEYTATQQAMNNAIEAAASAIGSILARYQAVIGQKVVVRQSTRQTGLITGPQAFQLPTGVKAISGGALVLIPGKSSNLVLDYGVIRKK